MKVRGYLLKSLNAYDWELESKGWTMRSNKWYSTPSSARRAANRVAKELGLETEWEKEER